MLESLPMALTVSTALGFLAGIGVGGGSLLILWLTLVLGMDHANARLFNLLFFLPSATAACLFRWKQGLLDFKKIAPAIIAGSTAAAIGSWLGTIFETDILKKFFGCLLILIGIRELMYSLKKKEHP
jgi:uncharacterized membrane protein YfcA